MEETQQNGNTVDEEAKAIQAAKLAAGISYPLLVVTAAHPDDSDKPGPRFAFRRPRDEEWFRYRSATLTNDPQVKARALQIIVIPCCIYPEQSKMLALFQERPGLVELCGGELVEYSGAEKAKKVERL